jgi:hypothetical protein
MIDLILHQGCSSTLATSVALPNANTTSLVSGLLACNCQLRIMHVAHVLLQVMFDLTLVQSHGPICVLFVAGQRCTLKVFVHA